MKELFQRSVFGLLYVFLIVSLVYYNLSPILFIIFGILALYELGKILHLTPGEVRFWYLFFVIAFLPWILTVALNSLFDEIPFFSPYISWMHSSGMDHGIISFLQWRWLWILMSLVIVFIRFYSKRWSGYLPVAYIILPFVLACEVELSDQDFEISPILYIFLSMWVFDTFSYIVGKLIGRRPIIPAISPGKTWEGLFGGLAGLLALNYALYSAHLLPFQYVFTGFLLAVVLGVFAFLGDMFESKLKRTAGLKDSGTVIPGHGGILDRIDSFLFAAPAFYILYPILLRL
ncbi:MAG: phosphatidate cytidylyltransferase [Thermaurantimonas sp.]